jgi:hypothetical protein
MLKDVKLANLRTEDCAIMRQNVGHVEICGTVKYGSKHLMDMAANVVVAAKKNLSF